MVCGRATSTFPVLLPHVFALRCPLHHKLLCTTLNTVKHGKMQKRGAPLLFQS